MLPVPPRLVLLVLLVLRREPALARPQPGRPLPALAQPLLAQPRNQQLVPLPLAGPTTLQW